MTEQQTREQFRKEVISKNHGLPYEDCLKKEFQKGCLVQDKLYKKIDVYNGRDSMDFDMYNKELTILGLPITIGRVMQALKNIDKTDYLSLEFELRYGEEKSVICWTKEDDKFGYNTPWQLTDDNGKELTHLEQPIETIRKLLELLISNQ